MFLDYLVEFVPPVLELALSVLFDFPLIGIITLPDGRHLAIAVFVSDSPAAEATREGVIAQTAKALVDAVGVRAPRKG